MLGIEDEIRVSWWVWKGWLSEAASSPPALWGLYRQHHSWARLDHGCSGLTDQSPETQLCKLSVSLFRGTKQEGLRITSRTQVTLDSFRWDAAGTLIYFSISAHF